VNPRPEPRRLRVSAAADMLFSETALIFMIPLNMLVRAATLRDARSRGSIFYYYITKRGIFAPALSD
jgi:hypothetical protein